MEILNSSGSGCSSHNKGLPPWEAFNTGVAAWSAFSPSDQEVIVRHFSSKVKFLALRMKAKLPQSVELGDLISAGTLGLMESFNKFKPCFGNKFDTYAENRIRGAMLDELRRLDWFPRSLRRKVKILDQAISKHERLNHDAPSEEELSKDTGFTIKEVREGLEAMQNQFCLSLDLLHDSLSPANEGRDGEPYSHFAFGQVVDKLSVLIDELTQREKLVLSLYYTDELNMRETAEVMGITEGRVSQLHSQALARLRKEFTSRYGTAHAP